MKALVMKDIGWLTFFFVAGTIASTAFVYGTTFERAWVLPPMWGNLEDGLILWCLSGLVFGLFAATREEFLRTEEYLRHRPVTPGRIFAVRTGACLLVAAAWVILPYVFQSLLPGLWSENRSIADFGRFGLYLAVGSSTCSSFALGYFAGTLRLGWIDRIVLGTSAAFVLNALSWSFTVDLGGPRGVSASPLNFFMVHVTITALLVFAAYRSFPHGRDADRPFHCPCVRTVGTVLILVGLLFAGLVASWGQMVTGDVLDALGPRVVLSEEGTVGLARWEVSRKAYATVDDTHRRLDQDTDPLAQALQRSTHVEQLREQRRGDDSRPSGLAQRMIEFRSQELGDDVRAISYAWYHIRSGSSWEQVALHRGEGLAYHYVLSSHGAPRTPSIRRLGRGPAHQPFSPEAYPFPTVLFSPDDVSNGVVSHSMQIRNVAIVEPEDRSIWGYTPNSGTEHFVKLALPGEDRIVYVRSETAGPTDGIDRELLPVSDDGSRTVVYGEKGAYVWNGEAFVVLPGREMPVSPAGGRRLVREVQDPFRRVVVLVDGEGAEQFRHVYGLHTVPEKIAGAGTVLLSFLRAPISQAASFLTPEACRQSDFRRSGMVDPLLAGGKRTWLLLCCLAVGTLLAWHTNRRLARLRIPKWRRLYWSLFVLAGGLLVYLLGRSIESERAWRGASPGDRGAPPRLLIASPDDEETAVA